MNRLSLVFLLFFCSQTWAMDVETVHSSDQNSASDFLGPTEAPSVGQLKFKFGKLKEVNLGSDIGVPVDAVRCQSNQKLIFLAVDEIRFSRPIVGHSFCIVQAANSSSMTCLDVSSGSEQIISLNSFVSSPGKVLLSWADGGASNQISISETHAGLEITFNGLSDFLECN